jgi:hypothetical protein
MPVTCNVCGRDRERGDRMGDTCGYPIAQPFRVKSADDLARDIVRIRLGEPLDEMTNPRCLGTLAKKGAR